MVALEAEEHDQVDAGTLDAAEWRGRDQFRRIGEGRTDAQDARQVVLDGRLVVGLRPELPAETRDQARRELVADGHARAGVAGACARGRLDLEGADAER